MEQTNQTQQENQVNQMQQESQTNQIQQENQANQIQQENLLQQTNQAQQIHPAQRMQQTNQMRQANRVQQIYQMQQAENMNAFAAPNRNVVRVFSAFVEDVSRDRGTTFVTITYHNCDGCATPTDTVRLVVSRDTDIFNEQGMRVRAGELERGMTVDASFSAAMTRSIPPQAQAFFIRITARAPKTETTTGRIAQVNTRGRFLIVMPNQNPASAIQFHITPETVILDFFGRRTNLSVLRPGLRVRVEHASFMTASIPPQTTAFVVQMIR